MKISELSNHLIYPSKYLKSNHLNKNINMKFKGLLSMAKFVTIFFTLNLDKSGWKLISQFFCRFNSTLKIAFC